jgi:uncharacterized membrane protein YebE (DUF533 family)
MFDAKSLLEMIVRGAAPNPAPQQPGGGLGGLADILGKMMQGQGGPEARNAAPAGGQGGGLEDLLRNLTQGQSGQGGQGGGAGGLGDLLKNMLPGGPQGGPPSPQQGQGAGGGLGDILGQLQKQLGGGQAGGGQGGGASGGGLMDILGQVLGQATQGAKEGAQRIDDATGAGRHARDAVGQATGRSPEDLLEQLKGWIAQNPGAAAAGAGGLGAVVLGTQTGRSVAASAAKLGALVLIGGLAYKAYQNYADGKPMIGRGQFVPEAAPNGSGFEPQAVTQESAALYIRAMIAAAAADGRIDATEQQKILGGLKQAGVDAEAEEFIANELNNPASAADLAGGVQSGEEAVQVFTAARIAIDLDTQDEKEFLVELAQRLKLDGKLIQHIDAAARGATA